MNKRTTKKTKRKAAVISNISKVPVRTEDGDTETVTQPKAMVEIIKDIRQLTGDWPRRIDNVLFVDDPEHGIAWLASPADLFGWLQRHGNKLWVNGAGLVTPSELFAEIKRTAPQYDGIELLPHEPPIPNIYYRGEVPERGDGSHLRQLLKRFQPETTVDHELIKAAFITPFWGGPAGARPAIVITADEGRGVGKTALATMIGRLCGGVISVDAGANVETLKSRLLSEMGQTKRIALLDNIKTMRLSWAELEALITSDVISGKRLYVGEGQRPNHLTWFITLNGASLATDMAQRSVIIKLSKAENDGPWYEETVRFIDEYREQIIGDIIAELRREPFALARYSRFAAWERDVVCRLDEPGEVQRVILERQNEANCELDEAEIIEEKFAEQLERLDYYPQTDQVRIPSEVAARWYCWAMNENMKFPTASKRLHQMAKEGQLKSELHPSRGEHMDDASFGLEQARTDSTTRFLTTYPTD